MSIQPGTKVAGAEGVFYADRAAGGEVLNLLVGGRYARVALDDGDRAVVPVNSLEVVESEAEPQAKPTRTFVLTVTVPASAVEGVALDPTELANLAYFGGTQWELTERKQQPALDRDKLIALAEAHEANREI